MCPRVCEGRGCKKIREKEQRAGFSRAPTSTSTTTRRPPPQTLAPNKIEWGACRPRIARACYAKWQPRRSHARAPTEGRGPSKASARRDAALSFSPRGKGTGSAAAASAAAVSREDEAGPESNRGDALAATKTRVPNRKLTYIRARAIPSSLSIKSPITRRSARTPEPGPT